MKLNTDFARNLKLPSVIDKPVYFIILGGALILAMTVMLFTGSADERESELALEQARRAVAQLREPVLGFKRLLEDEEVLALADLALTNPEKQGELSHYLTGRMREVKDARVFDPDIFTIDVESLGENGYVMLNMIMAAREFGAAPIQSFKVENAPVIAGAVRIGEAESISGYLLVTADAEVILSAFNMTLPKAGYIGLDQNNGRFKANALRYFGDPSLAMYKVERLVVPNTLFRIVVPQGVAPSSFGGLQRILLFLLGGLCLAYGLIKRQLALRPEVPGDATPAQKLEPDPVPPMPQMTAAARRPAAPVVKDPPAVVPAARPREPAAAEPGQQELDETAVIEETGSSLEIESPEEVDSPAETDGPRPMPEITLPNLDFDPQQRRGRRKKLTNAVPVELTEGIFRAYDIRGIIEKTLDAGIAHKIGQAVGSQAVDQGVGPVVVGRDGRHSGPELVDGLVAGIASTGCDVIDIGAVPTGVLYFVAHETGKGTGVMVTGSHNPPDYNGFKVMMGGETLAGDKITALYERLQSGEIRIGKGQVTKEEALGRYRDRIASDIQLARPLKVVADCGNGIGGICAADVLRSIGAEVLPLYDEVDGSFPNHHPNPSDPENMQDLIESVRLMGADLGVAFDGDADRLGVVTPSGEIVFADRVMMLFVDEILGRNPGARIIYDVKCTGHLDTVIREAGGEPEMYKTGHSLIKNRMKEVDAPFAGEMSGHFFFTDRWYGFDCGIYSACRLLEILAADDRTPEQVLSSLPNSISTPELKVYMEEGENHAFIAEFQQKARFADARISTIDGVRADFEDGWGLCRASNTTPVLIVRFDAESEESLEVIKEAFRMQMLAIRPDLKLPF